MSTWSDLLLAATAVHAGFQATVTVVAYPTLLRVRAEDWDRAHTGHSHRIAPLVTAVYGAVLLTGGGAVLLEPSPGAWVAAAASAAALLVTAAVAAPTHARLGTGLTAEAASRLLRWDRVRLALALLALAGALMAALA